MTYKQFDRYKFQKSALTPIFHLLISSDFPISNYSILWLTILLKRCFGTGTILAAHDFSVSQVKASIYAFLIASFDDSKSNFGTLLGRIYFAYLILVFIRTIFFIFSVSSGAKFWINSSSSHWLMHVKIS